MCTLRCVHTKFAKVMFSQVFVCLRGGFCPGRGSLSGGVCPRGLYPGGSLSRGSLSYEFSVQGFLCLGGSLSWGFSIQGGLCPGGLGLGDLCLGDLCQGDPPLR